MHAQPEHTDVITSLVDLGPEALADDAHRDVDTAQALRDYLAARALAEPA